MAGGMDVGQTGVLAGVSSKWDEFLDWSDEHGLPFRGVSDWLDEKGIPPAPALLLLLLLFVAGIAFLVLPALTGPGTGDVKVTLLDADGNPLSGVSIQLSSTNPETGFAPRVVYTDKAGVATFAGVPVEEVLVKASPEGYAPVEQRVTPTKGKVKEVAFSSPVLTQKTVAVSLEVVGPGSGDSVSTTIYDELWNALQEAKPGLKPSFTIPANTTFQIRVTAPGFAEANLVGKFAGGSDVFLGQVALKEIPSARRAGIHASVVEELGKAAVDGADVQVLDAVTNAVLASGETGKDGAAPVLEVAAGSLVKVKAVKDGYLPEVSDSLSANADDAKNKVELALRRAGQESRLEVEVVDAGGKAVENPVVRVYLRGSDGSYSVADEQKPLSGVAQLKLPQSQGNSSVSLSVYGRGFLPQFFPQVAGGQRRVVLVKAEPDVSSRLKVHVSNFDDTDAAGASVALFASDRTPLGVVEKVTGPDGIQVFDDLPRAELVVAASASGRSGESRAVLAGGNESAEVVLDRGTGSVKAVVTDHFTGKPVAGAKVAVAGFEDVECTTNADGVCSVKATESVGASAGVSAVGYEEYATAPFDIKPNTETKLEAGLTSSSIAATTKLELIGIFDKKGSQVTSLEPASEYYAKFVARAPPIGFTGAKAFVSVGGAEERVSDQPVFIAAYSSSGALRALAGSSFDAARAFVANGSGGGADAAEQASDPAAKELKWVEFTYPVFKGSQEVVVWLQTREKTQARTVLNYRTEYETSGEVVRNPADSEAGVSKSALLARTYTEPVDVSFEGTCSEGVCVQLYFDEAGSRKSVGSYEAEVGREFALVFHATARNSSLSARLESPSQAVGIVSAEAGDESAKPVTDAAGVAGVSIDAKAGDGRFNLRGQRVSSDARLDFKLSDAGGSSSFEKTVFVRVNSQGTPSLRVQVKPGVLTALSDQQVEFTVTDSLGLPVSGCRVTVGDVEKDALGRIAEAAEVEGRPGVYSAQGVNPSGVGFVSYRAEAQGFAVATGRLQVSARDIISVREAFVEMAVTSPTEPVSAPITIENLLNNEVSVSLSVLRDRVSQSIDVSADPSLPTRVGAKGALNAFVTAQLAQGVLALADRPLSINDSIRGRARVSAGVGAARQVVEVPFTVSASVVVQAIDKVWSADADSLALEMAPPKENTAEQSFTVTNDGPLPLLVNAELSIVGAGVSPLSAEIPSGGGQKFTVGAKAPASLATGQCVFEEKARSAPLVLWASYQGLRSRKEIPVTVTSKASGTCLPEKVVTLPLSMSFEIPTDAKRKSNDDGTTAVQLADGRRIAFGAAAKAGARSVDLEFGNELFIEPSMVVQQDAGGFDLTLPVAASLVIPDGVPVVNLDGENSAVAGNARVSFPNVAFLSSQAGGGRAARLAAGSVVKVRPLAVPDSRGNAEVKLPAKVVFQFPANSISQPTQDGGVAVGLPGGGLVAFSADAEASKPADDGSLSVAAPEGSSVLFPPSLVTFLPSGGFSLRLPARAAVEVPADAEVASGSGGVVVFLESYDLVLPLGTTFGASEGGKSAQLGSGSVVTFKSIGGDALSSNAARSLPFAFELYLPADARVEESSVGKLVSFQSGEVIGLPDDAVVSDKAVDGSRVAFVPAGDKVSVPAAVASVLPNGGMVFKPPVSYAVGVAPQAASSVEGGATVFALAEYDVKVPVTGSTRVRDGIAWTPAIAARAATQVVPIADIVLGGMTRVALPLAAEALLSPGTRVKKNSDGIAGLAPDGKAFGFAPPAEMADSGGNATALVTVPVGAALVLLPSDVTPLPSGNGIEFTIPYQLSLSFDETVDVLRRDGVSLVGEEFVMRLPQSTRLASDGSSGGVATVPSGSAVQIEALNFSVAGEEQSLPLELAAAIQGSSLVRQKSDGRVYAELGAAHVLFGAGATVEGGKVHLPASVPSAFGPGIITPLLSLGTGQPRDFAFKLPVAYSFFVPGTGASLSSSADGGKVAVLEGGTAVFPASASVVPNPAGLEVRMPAGSATRFYGSVGGVAPLGQAPGFVDGAAAAFNQLPPGEVAGGFDALSEQDRVGLASRSNLAVVTPVQLEFELPPGTPAGDTGEPVIWLSRYSVIVFSGASIQASPSGWRSIVVPEGSQISLPPNLMQMTTYGFIIKPPVAFTVAAPATADVTYGNGLAHVLLEDKKLQVILKPAPKFAESQEFLRGRMAAGSHFEVAPYAADKDGLQQVTLPIDARVFLPQGARQRMSGSEVSVRFADGMQARFTGAAASDQSGKVIQWPAGSQALLPPEFALALENGGWKIRLPAAVELVLPGDARLSKRGSFIATLPTARMQVIAPDAQQAKTQEGTVLRVPAAAEFEVSPFGLDVLGGQPVSVPLEMTVLVPDGAVVDENAQGGVVVDFGNNLRAKFAGGALSSSSSFPPVAYATVAAPVAGQMLLPYSSTASATSASQQTASGPQQLTVPPSSAITLPTQLITPIAYDEWSQSSPTALQFALPAPFKLSGAEQAFTNPDGTISIFVQDTEVRLPPIATRIDDTTFAVPAFSPVVVVKVHPDKLSGAELSLPFDLRISLQGVRAIPSAGSSTLDFGSGKRIVITGTEVTPESTDVSIPKGTKLRLSPGVISALPDSIASKDAQADYQGGAFALAIPSASIVSFEQGARAYKNADGTQSAFVEGLEVRLPPGSAQPSRSPGGQGVSFAIPASGPILVIPIPFSEIKDRASTLLNLPVGLSIAVPPDARVLPPAGDGSFAINFVKGVLSFPAEAAQKDAKVAVAAGIPFYASKEIAVQKDGAIELTLPSNFEFTSSTSPAKDAAGNTYSILEKGVEIIIPGEAVVNGGGNSFTTLAARGSRVVIRSLSALLPPSADRQPVSFPVDAKILLSPEAKVLPPADDGTWMVELLPSGSLVFQSQPPDKDRQVALPAGTEFYPSSQLVKVEKQSDAFGSRAISFTLTLPLPVVFTTSTAPVPNPDGSWSVISGMAELVAGPGSQQRRLDGDKGFELSVPRNSPITVKPVDVSLGDVKSITSPEDIIFRLPADARVLPEAGDGSMAVKFPRNGEAIAFGAGAAQTTDAGTRAISLPAGATLAPSASLLKPLGKGKGWRLALPADLVIVLPDDKRLAKTTKGYVISGDYSQIIAPPNCRIEKGSVKLVIPAGSIIEIKELDFSTEGLQAVKLPVQSTFNLPTSSSKITDPVGSTVIYDFGSERIAFSGEPKETKSASATSLSVDADLEFMVRKEHTAATPGGFSITLPFAWSFTFPSGTRTKAIGNELEVRLANGASVFVPSGLSSTQGTTLATTSSASSPGGVLSVTGSSASSAKEQLTTSSISIPALTRVRVAVTEKDLQDLTGTEPGTQSFNVDFNGYLLVGEDSDVRQSGNTVTATLTRCQPVKVFDTNANPRLDLPEAIQAIVTNAQADAKQEGASNRRISFSAGAKITVRTCNPKEAAARTYTAYFPVTTTFYLPVDTLPKPLLSGALEPFPAPPCRAIHAIGVTVDATGTERIDFGSVPMDAKPDDRRETTPNQKPRVIVSPNKPVKFTLCDNPVSSGAATDVGTTGAQGVLSAEPANLTVEFSEGKLQVSQEVELKNNGPVDVGVNLDATGISEEIKSFTSPAQVEWEGFPAKSRSVKITPVPKTTTPYKFRLNFTLPLTSDYVDLLTGCITKDAQIDGKVTFSGTEDQTNAPATVDVAVHVSIKRNPGKCAAQQKLERDMRFSGFYATHAKSIIPINGAPRDSDRKLSFKAGKTTRVFAIVNNLNDKVKLSSAWSNGPVAVCKILVAPSGKDKATEWKDIDGFEIDKGDAVVVNCTATLEKQGENSDLTIAAEGASGKSKAIVAEQVFKPETSTAATYRTAGSPWGQVCVGGASGSDTDCTKELAEKASASGEAANKAAAASASPSPATASTTPPEQPPKDGSAASSTGQQQTSQPTPTPTPQGQPAGQPPSTGSGSVDVTKTKTAGTSGPSRISLEGLSTASLQASPKAVGSAGSTGGVQIAQTSATGGEPIKGSLEDTSPITTGFDQFTLCEEFFCSEKDAAAAYRSHVAAFYNTMHTVFSNAGEGKAISAKDMAAEFTRRYGGVVRKSFVLQIAGRNNIDWKKKLEAEAKSVFQTWKPTVQFDVQQDQLKTCGVYVVHTELKLPSPDFAGVTEADWLGNSNTQLVSTVTQVMPCEKTVANAALLVGAPKDVAVGKQTVPSPTVVVGRELVFWPGELANIGGGVDWSRFPPAFRRKWEVRTYSRYYSKMDLATAKALYASLYGQPLPLERSFPAPLYNNKAFCADSTFHTMYTIEGALAVATGVQLLYTVVSAVSTALSGGLTLPQTTASAGTSVVLTALKRGFGNVRAILSQAGTAVRGTEEVGTALSGARIGARLAAKQMGVRLLECAAAAGGTLAVDAAKKDSDEAVCDAATVCVDFEVFNAISLGFGFIGQGIRGIRTGQSAAQAASAAENVGRATRMGNNLERTIVQGGAIAGFSAIAAGATLGAEKQTPTAPYAYAAAGAKGISALYESAALSQQGFEQFYAQLMQRPAGGPGPTSAFAEFVGSTEVVNTLGNNAGPELAQGLLSDYASLVQRQVATPGAAAMAIAWDRVMSDRIATVSDQAARAALARRYGSSATAVARAAVQTGVVQESIGRSATALALRLQQEGVFEGPRAAAATASAAASGAPSASAGAARRLTAEEETALREQALRRVVVGETGYAGTPLLTRVKADLTEQRLKTWLRSEPGQTAGIPAWDLSIFVGDADVFSGVDPAAFDSLTDALKENVKTGAGVRLSAAMRTARPGVADSEIAAYFNSLADTVSSGVTHGSNLMAVGYALDYQVWASLEQLSQDHFGGNLLSSDPTLEDAVVAGIRSKASAEINTIADAQARVASSYVQRSELFQERLIYVARRDAELIPAAELGTEARGALPSQVQTAYDAEARALIEAPPATRLGRAVATGRNAVGWVGDRFSGFSERTRGMLRSLWERMPQFQQLGPDGQLLVAQVLEHGEITTDVVNSVVGAGGTIPDALQAFVRSQRAAGVPAETAVTSDEIASTLRQALQTESRTAFTKNLGRFGRAGIAAKGLAKGVGVALLMAFALDIELRPVHIQSGPGYSVIGAFNSPAIEGIRANMNFRPSVQSYCMATGDVCTAENTVEFYDQVDLGCPASQGNGACFYLIDKGDAGFDFLVNYNKKPNKQASEKVSPSGKAASGSESYPYGEGSIAQIDASSGSGGNSAAVKKANAIPASADAASLFDSLFKPDVEPMNSFNGYKVRIFKPPITGVARKSGSQDNSHPASGENFAEKSLAEGGGSTGSVVPNDPNSAAAKALAAGGTSPAAGAPSGAGGATGGAAPGGSSDAAK